MTTPLVSVLIPCYNAAPYVGAAVSSALNQTWQNLEVIVVDDGSTDGSADVLATIEDPRLTVIRQDNRGQCAAANRAYRSSRGELVKFFDADDLLSLNHIALQVERLGPKRTAVAMGEWVRFFDDNHDDAVFLPLRMYRDTHPVEWLADEWVGALPMMQCALWLIPRGIVDQVGLWDERLSLINDFEFFTRILLGADEIVYSPGARLYYRSGIPGSLSGRKSRKAVESAFLSISLATEHLLAAEDSDRTRRAAANIFKSFEYTYFPAHADLRRKARQRVGELGGSDLQPDGPPGFHKLRPWIGWRLARRVQHWAEVNGLNGAARAR